MLRAHKKKIPHQDLYAKHEALVKKCRHPSVQQSHISEKVRKCVQKKDFALIGTIDDYFKLSTPNFHEPLQVMLNGEEFYQSVQLRKLDREKMGVDYKGLILHNRKLVPSFQYVLSGLSKLDVSLIPSDFVVLEYNGDCRILEIVEIDRDIIIFVGDEDDDDFTRRGFNISVVPSGMMFARFREVLSLMSESGKDTRMLFEHPNDQQVLEAKIHVDATNTESLKERLSKCNDSQRQAIVGMLEAKCRPKPFILFGPPGTGKSFTVVEAVVQIHGRSPKARILVCANSNNCADQLAAAIDETNLCDDSLVRLCAEGHYNKLGEDKQRYHLDSSDFKEIGEDEFRVVVTTNSMSYALCEGTYDYVIVDEAGHAHIPETFTPASRLASGGCLVLAGDPKQLGPVIKCEAVENLGFGVSALETLFKLSVYSFKPEGYDSNFITQLRICYRCDPRILEPCNELFYNKQLTCKGMTPPGLLESLCVAKPLVFHSVWGRHEKPQEMSTSLINEDEAQTCADIYIKLLRIGIQPKRVGIISHYKPQTRKITQVIKQKLEDKSSDIIEALRVLDEADEKSDFVRISSSDMSYLASKLGATRIVDEHTHPSAGPSKCDHDKSGEESTDTGVVVECKSSNSSVRQDSDPHRWLCKVDTVDGFQGKEKEIIIISTVRCCPRWDFVFDPKRFNVAISRAKWAAIVVGYPAVLQCHENWQTFERHATRAHISLD